MIIILYNLHVRDEFDWPNSGDAIRLRYALLGNRERIITREVTASQLAASFQVIRRCFRRLFHAAVSSNSILHVD